MYVNESVTGRFIVMTLAGLLAGIPFASAQDNPISGAKGLQPNREYFSQFPFEYIDTSTGSLVLTFTDLVLPGHGGRDVKFQRTYNSKDKRWTFGIAGYPLYIYEPGMPPLLAGPETFEPTIFTADGAEHKTLSMRVVNTGSVVDILGTFSLVSTDRFWRYLRTSSHDLYLPDGTHCRYTGSFNAWEVGLKRLSHCYSPHAPEAGAEELAITWEGATATVTQRVLNEKRTVTIDFVGGGVEALPASLTFMGRTWTYDWHGTDPITEEPLATAQPPAGPGWEYRFQTTTFPWTLTIKTPQGGQVGYDIENKRLPGLDLPGYTDVHSVVVTRRWTRDRGTTETHEWTYDYFTPTADAEIYTPTGSRIAYTHVPGTALPMTRTVSALVDGTWVVQESETREYVDLPVVHYPAVGTALTATQLKKRWIDRDGRRYTTEYQYRNGPNGYLEYGDYHRPSRITATSANLSSPTQPLSTRITDLEYAWRDDWSPVSGSTTAFLSVGHLTKEDVTIDNGQTFTRTRAVQPSSGRVDAETVYGVTTTFSGFLEGQPGLAFDANGRSTTYAYAWGMTFRIGTPKHTTIREVHADGTVRSERTGAGTANERVTFYEHNDPLFRVTKIVPPGSGRAATAIEYAADGTWTRTTRGASWTKTTVDGFGRPITTENSDGVTVRTKYDAEGRTIHEGYPTAGPADHGVDIAYDVLGRVTKRTNPGPAPRTTVQFSYGPGAVTVTDENGRDTVQRFQAFGHPSDARLVGLTDASEQEWSYQYNSIGQLTKVIAPDTTTREWVYNEKGWLTQEVHPESGVTTYGYGDDLVGNVQTRTDAENQTIAFDYDENNRLNGITAGAEAIVITYEIGSDNRAQTSVGADWTLYLYDDAGRLQGLRTVVGGRAFDTRFTLDARDNIDTITYPSMRTARYTFDGENRIARIWDPLAGRDYATNFAYHPSGAIAGYTAGNGIAISTTYDAARYWPTSINSGPLQLTYSYDGVGNVESIGDGRGGSWSQAFTYDALDRVKTASGAYGSVGYAYDLHGNMTTQGSDTYTYNPLTLRMASRNGQAITHNNNGSIVAEGAALYTYTARNQMATASVNGLASTYRYDADEWRVMKITPDGTTTYYVRDAQGRVLSELLVTAAGTENRREYIYAGARLIAVIER